MPLYKNYPVSDRTISTVDSGGGTPAGKSSTIVSTPIRGRLMRIGATFTSSISSVVTVALTKFNAVVGSSQVLASVAYSTADTPAGAAVIVDLSPSASTQLEEGDGIQFTTSGGPTSTVAANYFAIIRP